MRRAVHCLAVLAALAVSILPPAARAADLPVTMPGAAATAMMGDAQGNLIRSLLPSVVNITIRKDVTHPTAGVDAGGSSESSRAYGSGFIIDSTGVIATNFHVVDGAWEIAVTFNDGSRAQGQLLKATRLIDVALIKVDVGHPLPTVHWGDSDKVQIGDPVFAIGNALGVGISVSGGIVSALNRDIMDSPYDDFIQTDAAINHGNSGGPLFNMRGEVIGIDTALISPTTASSGVGFAIPSNGAQFVIDRLMNYGWLRPGWIGVKIQQLTPEMAQALGMTVPEGSIVANVTPGGPAQQAGLRIGDVITRLGHVSPSDERAILRSIAKTPIGNDVTLGLWRNGAPATITVNVREWPRNQWNVLDAPVAPEKPHYNVPTDLGIKVAALDADNRARFGIKLDQPGILVTGVTAGTDAADRGLTPGDVILRVQEKTVTTAADVQAAFDAARAAKRNFVLVLLQRKVGDKPGPEWMALRITDS